MQADRSIQSHFTPCATKVLPLQVSKTRTDTDSLEKEKVGRWTDSEAERYEAGHRRRGINGELKGGKMKPGLPVAGALFWRSAKWLYVRVCVCVWSVLKGVQSARLLPCFSHWHWSRSQLPRLHFFSHHLVYSLLSPSLLLHFGH